MITIPLWFIQFYEEINTIHSICALQYAICNDLLVLVLDPVEYASPPWPVELLFGKI